MRLEHIIGTAENGTEVRSKSDPTTIFKAIKNPFDGLIDWIRYQNGDDGVRVSLAAFTARDFRRDDYVASPF